MYSVVYRIRKGFKLSYIKTSNKKGCGLKIICVLEGTRSSLPIYGISSPLICFLYSFSLSQPRVWFPKKKQQQQQKPVTANTTTAQNIKKKRVVPDLRR